MIGDEPREKKIKISRSPKNIRKFEILTQKEESTKSLNLPPQGVKRKKNREIVEPSQPKSKQKAVHDFYKKKIDVDLAGLPATSSQARQSGP